jgi:hypothetical protein
MSFLARPAPHASAGPCSSPGSMRSCRSFARAPRGAWSRWVHEDPRLSHRPARPLRHSSAPRTGAPAQRTLRGVRAFPTGLRPSRPLAGRLSGTSCSIRHRASTPPTPTPRPTTLRAVPSSSTSPCPPTLTTDSGALHNPSLVLGRRPSAHGLGPSNHPAVLSPSRPFTLPSRRRESSPLASPEPAAYHSPRANRAVGLSFTRDRQPDPRRLGLLRPPPAPARSRSS